MQLAFSAGFIPMLSYFMAAFIVCCILSVEIEYILYM